MTPTTATNGRPILNVAELPAIAYDDRAPVWWGNLLMIAIETTTVLLLVASYFYYRQNFQTWPPTRPYGPPVKGPLPDLLAGTANLVLLTLSCVPMAWVDREARKKNRNVVVWGLVGLTVAGALSMGLRALEFPALRVHWTDNAYGSVVWAILVLHLLYIGAAAAEVGLLAVWIYLHGLDDKHAVDVTLSAGYWYWMAGIWVLLYVVVYWAPRFL